MRLSLPVRPPSRRAEATRAVPPPARPWNVAHRGASAAAPENTLAAIRAAAALGADMVELDVQRTRDGVLVLVHDTTYGRTTDARRVLPDRGPWRVRDLTLAEVRRLDAGGWHDPVHAGEPVPTLIEALDVAGDLGLGVQLELKLPGDHPGVVGDLLAELRAAAARSAPGATRAPLVVQSFDVVAMKELKTRAPHLTVGVLGAPPVSHLPALAGWCDQVNPRHAAVDGGYVARVHEAGMQCLVWTVDRPRMMRRAIRMGVDGVITNRPDVLRPLLTGAHDLDVVRTSGSGGSTGTRSDVRTPRAPRLAGS